MAENNENENEKEGEVKDNGWLFESLAGVRVVENFEESIVCTEEQMSQLHVIMLEKEQSNQNLRTGGGSFA